MPPSPRRLPLALMFATLSASFVVLWTATPATAANKNVEIVTGGTYRPIGSECDAASYAYNPIEVPITPGDTVTFANPRDSGPSHPCEPAQHPTRCAPETNFGKTKGECPFSNFALDVGDTHTQSFPAEGTFQLQCLVHPYMLMTVVVGDGEPGPEPTEPAPEPTETEPEPEPTVTEPGPGPTATEPPSADPTATTSVAPSPTASSSEPDATEQPTVSEPLPTEAPTDPMASDDVEAGGSSTARGPLLLLATALLGFNVAFFVQARGPFAMPSWLR